MHACGTFCVFHREATRLITPDLTTFPWNEEAPARAQPRQAAQFPGLLAAGA